MKKISSFTFTSQTVLGGSAAGTGNISLAVTGNPIVVENMKSGDSVNTTLTVDNNGTIDVLYYLSADWGKGEDTSSRMATILANRLMVTVTADPEGTKVELYTGTLTGLLDQPSAGRALSVENGSEDVLIAIEVPAEATNIIQNLSIVVDFVFVAEEQ